jgi:hypothetical protein
MFADATVMFADATVMFADRGSASDTQYPNGVSAVSNEIKK